MASAITTYGASYVLNVMFGQRDLAPDFYFMALLTQAPGTQTDGSLITEPPVESGYSRVQVLNDLNTFGGAANAVVATTAQIAFPVATADWPTVTHYALCDTEVGGNVYLYGSFNIPRRVFAGDQARIAPQGLSLTVGSLSSALSSTF